MRDWEKNEIDESSRLVRELLERRRGRQRPRGERGERIGRLDPSPELNMEGFIDHSRNCEVGIETAEFEETGEMRNSSVR